jgi:regulator of sirC expression with transglutaminase-like and TPR domain
LSYASRGVVYANLGDMDRAMDDLETALELAPDAPWADEVEAWIEELKSQQ